MQEHNDGALTRRAAIGVLASTVLPGQEALAQTRPEQRLGVSPSSEKEKELFTRIDEAILALLLQSEIKPFVVDARQAGDYPTDDPRWQWQIRGITQYLRFSYDSQFDAEAPTTESEKAKERTRLGLPENLGTIIIVMCFLGERSAATAQYIAKLGYTNVLSIEGGLEALTNLTRIPDMNISPEKR